MNVWSVHRHLLGGVGGLAIALSAASAYATPVRAVTPTPTPGLPCPSMMNVVDGTIDASLNVALAVERGVLAGDVVLSWTTSGSSNCAWIQSRNPDAASYAAFADWVFGSGAGTVTTSAVGVPGTYCYRLFAVSAAGHSEPSEACLAVSETEGPRSPDYAGTPEPGTPFPVGTPWPAPQGVALIGHVILLDDNNFPLPPDKQSWFAGLRWSVLEGFSGSYDVQRAVRPRGTGALDWGTVHATIPASAAVAGMVEFEEQILQTSIASVRFARVSSGVAPAVMQPDNSRTSPR